MWLARAVLAVALLVFAAVLVRVAQFQLVGDATLAEHVGVREAVVTTTPVRGALMDRRGRVLATTRFAPRVFVDPTRFPSPPGGEIVSLAEAVGLSPAEVGERVVAAMALNESVAASGGSLRRYVRITGPLDAGSAERVRALAIPGVYLEDVPVRDYSGTDELASLLGKVGTGDIGLLGIEHAFEDRLSGVPGGGRYVRDASREPLWIAPGSWNPASPGESVRLSVDAVVQRIAIEELHRGVFESDAAGGRVLVADPMTGEILAMADLIREVPDATPYPWWPRDQKAAGPVELPRARYSVWRDDEGRRVHPALARNRCVEDIYEPGSSFKPFVWALLTDAGLASIDETFETHRGFWVTPYGRIVQDVTGRESMTWLEVLINSSNIGMVKATDRMSFRDLHDGVRSLGFGAPTRLGVPGEASGLVTPMSRWKKHTQTSVSFGHEIAVTPMQMIRAFSAFCRTGDLAGTIPDLTLEGVRHTGVGLSRRVFSPPTVLRVREGLAQVAERVEAGMARRGGERGWRYSMFGKSGTADLPVGPGPEGFRRPPGTPGYLDEQYVSSFVAGAPVSDPRIAVVVVIDDPGPTEIRERRHYGSQSAGPVVRRITERTLSYLQVTPDLDPTPEKSGG
ncbi:MAG: penicillin-binding protein 2 [Planctomycetota bacterium]